MTPHEVLNDLSAHGDPDAERLALALRLRGLGPPVRRFRVSPSGETVLDVRTGLTWQRVAGPRLTWAEAKKYAEQLPLDGGGWRLPTVEELIGLVDYSRYDPAIDIEAFPNTLSSSLWSSTQGAFNSSFAWLVYFGFGGANTYNQDSSSSVRCVR